MTLSSRDFHTWIAKAPVAYVGAQRTAVKLYRDVKPMLMAEEIRDVDVAIEHALNGEGRAEFDRIAEKIRGRLFAHKKRKTQNRINGAWG